MNKRLPVIDKHQTPCRPTSNTQPAIPFTALLVLCWIMLLSLHIMAQAPATYTLTWADEFNSTTLDTTQWKYRVGASGTSYQRPENVVMDNGKMRINLKKEPYQGKSYTGGGIITKLPRRYGYYEVSVKIDGGYGWHEAFWTTWLCGFDDPDTAWRSLPGRTEIDCLEHYAGHANNYFTYGAIEWAPHHGNINRDYQTVVPNLATSYNTFGFEYTPDYLNYFFNGRLLKTIDMRNRPSHDFYLWLSTIATKADATDSGAVFFDYLRCYSISPANYAIRKVPFLHYLDSLRGTSQSALLMPSIKAASRTKKKKLPFMDESHPFLPAAAPGPNRTIIVRYDYAKN
jgi:hypothetical protein